MNSRNAISRAPVLATIMVGSLACTPPQPSPSSTSPTLIGQGCEATEEVVFAGNVEDDFGLSVAVCLERQADENAPRITVRYSGEGGGSAVSCIAGQCEGLIRFEHYVRYRFTVLTLSWFDENGSQRIVETFDAQAPDEEPTHALTHTWLPSSAKIGSEADIDAPQEYPIIAETQQLALLRLDPFFRR
ncbi:MAG: hypothetical protein ABJ239_08100 [Erythrobacter sp.]